MQRVNEWTGATEAGGEEKLPSMVVQGPQLLEFSSVARGLIQEETDADVCPFQASETTSYQHTPRFFEGCVNISTWGPSLGSDASHQQLPLQV